MSLDVNNQALAFHSNWDIDQVLVADEVTLSVPYSAYPARQRFTLYTFPTAYPSGEQPFAEGMFKCAYDASWHQVGELGWLGTPSSFGAAWAVSAANCFISLITTNTALIAEIDNWDVSKSRTESITIRYIVYDDKVNY